MIDTEGVFVWWSRSSAEQGYPWCVYINGAIVCAKSITIRGEVETVTSEGGFDLPDGPRGMIVVRSGEIEIDGEREPAN